MNPALYPVIYNPAIYAPSDSEAVSGPMTAADWIVVAAIFGPMALIVIWILWMFWEDLM